MAWQFQKSGKMFVAFGDLIMPRGVLGYSGSVNFSARDVLSSLKKLRALKVNYVLPGHGAVGGPAHYLHAGIDVGQAVGWGFIKPEWPDPRFFHGQEFQVFAASAAVVEEGHVLGDQAVAEQTLDRPGKIAPPDGRLVPLNGCGFHTLPPCSSAG
jgi:hypothetical protein